MSAAKLQRLRDRVAELEELCGLRDRFASRAFAGWYRGRVELIAKLLLARELVGIQAIALAFGGEVNDVTVRVYVSHARRALRAHGINLKTEWGRGWYLEAADKARLRGLLQGAQK